MLIIFQGLGLVWAFLGILLLLMVFFITGSAGAAFTAVAACWIYCGRGHFEPGASRNLSPDGKRIAPAVFFIPVWVYGLFVIPLALGGFFLDLTYQRSDEVKDFQGLSANPDSASTSNSNKQRFQNANHAITTSKKGSVHGNSELARVLAARYSELMKEISEAAFTGGGKGAITLTDGEFLVYCQRNEGKSVALLVHVPQLRQYKDEVREALSDLCWKAARILLKDTGASDDIELAVALRGTLLYGPIMIDRLASEKTADNQSQESLYRFFPEPVNETTAAGREPGNNVSPSKSLSSNDGDVRRLKIAENKLNSSETYQGNTRSAQDLATEYGVRLEMTLNDTDAHLKRGTPIVLDRGFHIYCQINEGKSVALLVLVPQMHRYNADMLDTLSDLCWKTARTLFRNKGAPDEFEIAISLQEHGVYGPTMIDLLANELTTHDQSEKGLYRFFSEPSTDPTDQQPNSISKP